MAEVTAIDSKLHEQKLKSLDNVMGQIEKAHGKGAVMRLGDDVRPPIAVIPTGAIALDVALGYADERIQFGKKISSFQLNQNKLATMQGNLVASESMMAQLARMEDRGSATANHFDHVHVSVG